MSDRTSDSESLLEMTDQSGQITDDISVETGGCDLGLRRRGEDVAVK